jgi:hypothetical protein
MACARRWTSSMDRGPGAIHCRTSRSIVTTFTPVSLDAICASPAIANAAALSEVMDRAASSDTFG